MQKNLEVGNPRYSEQISPFQRPFLISRSHCSTSWYILWLLFLVPEYHFHKTDNYMKGHVCVVGDQTTLNDQSSSQRYKLLA